MRLPFRRPIAALRPASRLTRCLLVAICAAAIASPVFGAPSYRIFFGQSGFPADYDVTQSTPFQHDAEYPLNVAFGTCTFTGAGAAYPGHVAIRDGLEFHWTGSNGSARRDVSSTATATDFVISGPAAASVAGQLHLRVRADLEHVGGFAGNASHGTMLNVDVRAKSAQFAAIGDFFATNHSTYGTGILVGLTDPNLDVSFVLAGNFPVGTPFDVVIKLSSVSTVYGNGGVTPNPGHVLTNAIGSSEYGLLLEEVSGQVMTLPAGYTLNSASWGVTDNHFASALAVEPESQPGDLRLSVGPNPSSGEVRLALVSPTAGVVRVALYDLSGRRIRLLSDGWREAGRSELVWDGRAADGSLAGAGLYFARVELGGRVASHRIVRVR